MLPAFEVIATDSLLMGSNTCDVDWRVEITGATAFGCAFKIGSFKVASAVISPPSLAQPRSDIPARTNDDTTDLNN